MKKIIVAFILLSFLPGTKIYSQTKEDISLAHSVLQAEPHEEEYHFSFDGDNELENLSSFLFVFYKKFISSQDVMNCIFHPSCSVFASEAIGSKGFVLGGMAAFDRMTRCHPLAAGHYPVHEESGLLHDPLPDSE